jgi:alkylation response protein AidB-like acyl-CoA dehydrogenase
MISGMGLGGQTGALGAALKDALADDPILRADVARFDVDMMAYRAMSERFIDELKSGQAHPALPSMMKYAGTELNKLRHELVMAAGGSNALEWESERSRKGKAAREWLRTKANSIEGGTSEIQLGIIAKRILDLPGA